MIAANATRSHGRRDRGTGQERDTAAEPHPQLGAWLIARSAATSQDALAVGPRGLPARRALARLDTSRAHALVDRLQHLRDLGQLPPDCDPADLARLLVVIIKGLAVQAASGTSQAELRVVAEPMMSYLPVRVT